jgi:nitric oxide reductase subunit B
MGRSPDSPGAVTADPVSNWLKWILLFVAVVSFALLTWATVLTYERAPPQPERLVTTSGETLMTSNDILVGKTGFQKADLMDYGSLYGMGSYFGQDYTAWSLSSLAGLVETDLAQANFGKPYDAAMRDAMRTQLQHVDLTQPQVTVPDALARAIGTLRDDIAKRLDSNDLETGWTRARSLSRKTRHAPRIF